MASWRNYFSHLLNVHEDNDVRQAEIHIVEPLVPEPSAFEVEVTIGKLKNHKLLIKSQQNRFKQGVG